MLQPLNDGLGGRLDKDEPEAREPHSPTHSFKIHHRNRNKAKRERGFAVNGVFYKQECLMQEHLFERVLLSEDLY